MLNKESKITVRVHSTVRALSTDFRRHRFKNSRFWKNSGSLGILAINETHQYNTLFDFEKKFFFFFFGYIGYSNSPKHSGVMSLPNFLTKLLGPHWKRFHGLMALWKLIRLKIIYLCTGSVRQGVTFDSPTLHNVKRNAKIFMVMFVELEAAVGCHARIRVTLQQCDTTIFTVTA